jgi:molybdate transport system permease protein
MANSEIWLALWLSVKLAGLTTLCLLVFGIPLAWWLSQTKALIRPVIESFITLPLILPPTVLGFYLLVLFSPQNIVGATWLRWFDHSLVFSFSGLLIGSIIYSLPFVVQPIKNSFSNITPELLDLTATLGATRWQRFYMLILPLSKPAIITGAILGFAHTLGEFGVVLLIGGNISGETRVLSIALYDLIESMQITQANWVAGGLLSFSFMVLLVLNLVKKANPNTG